MRPIKEYDLKEVDSCGTDHCSIQLCPKCNIKLKLGKCEVCGFESKPTAIG